MIRKKITSAAATNKPNTNTVTITTKVESINSFRVGQEDFFNSAPTSFRKFRTFINGFVMSQFPIA